MTRNTWLAAVAVIAGLAAVSFLRANRPTNPDAETVAPVSVTVATVARRDLPLTIAAAGRAEAVASVSVKSRLDGQVAEVAYKEGQGVHKGQLLLRFDTAVLEAQQRQAEGVVARDEAQLAKASSDYQRNVALVARAFVAKNVLTQSQADLAATQASIKVDRASLDNARLQLGYARVIAPMDGVAGAVLLPVGGAAKANDTTLLVINQVDPIRVAFPVPESQLAPLRLAMARGGVPVDATIEGIAQPIHGKLSFIDNAVDTASGTIIAKALFDNPRGVLTPGQFARVSVQVETLRGVLAVPSEAVESGVDGTYAFVVDAAANVAIRRVAVGVETAGYRVVTSGLSPGDRVVTTGQALLRNRSKVTIAASSSGSGEPP